MDAHERSLSSTLAAERWVKQSHNTRCRHEVNGLAISWTLPLPEFPLPITLREMRTLPRLLITLGDVAGIGPEIVVAAWPQLTAICQPVVVGDATWVCRTAERLEVPVKVVAVTKPDEAEPGADLIPCLAVDTADLRQVKVGQVSAAAGRAAYDFLCRAIDLTLAGQADGIVTAPLHKEGLRAAGLPYPGHTEILAERTGTRRFAMLLSTEKLTVAHVTLHMALRQVFANLSTQAVLEKIQLLADILPRLTGRPPRIGVAALNPHASDGGLFGDEEATLIRPAVERAQSLGIEATGPLPADTLFVRANRGEFDGIVAMYHDQGHIALKLLGGTDAVNISAGLPIVRTSVAHGTAYDIAGKGVADARGMVTAVRVAARLAANREPLSIARLNASNAESHS
jgi:4-hydroxythreonine-4-phosphate dehydrogenase